MITHKLEIGFGVGQDKFGQTICLREREAALRKIKDIASHCFGGCTLVSTTGVWVSPEGKVFDEPGCTLIVYLGTQHAPNAPYDLAEYVKTELRQEAVFVVLTRLEMGKLV